MYGQIVYFIKVSKFRKDIFKLKQSLLLIKLKQSLLLKLLGICHVFVFVCLTFENSNQIKLVQIGSNCIRLIIW